MKKIFLLTAFCFIILNSLAQQQPTVGLIKKDSGSEDGYVLFYPEFCTSTYLIDKCGYLVHTWTSSGAADDNADLLPDGTLFRPRFPGYIERLDWNSNVLWSYPTNNDTEFISHAASQMPNGDALAVIWEIKTIPEAVNEGFDTSLLQGGTAYITTSIKEIKPIGTDSGVVVWQWNAWDHMIQDHDANKPNYGVVSAHPERININYITLPPDYRNAIELLHTNAVDYNPKLDQIMISNRHISEFWIIDHSTTTAQAATDSGGKYGKGGGILYRWGNPAAYDMGTVKNQTEFAQHDCQWIDSGLSGAGHVLIFNNGYFRPGPVKYSEADEVITPVDSTGSYPLPQSGIYGPTAAYWIDTTPTFYSYVIGGVQRLPNGNTLICNGTAGAFYEVDSNKNLLWEYINPVVDSGILYQGQVPIIDNPIDSESNDVYRCSFYPPSYPGLAGHDLTPTAPIERTPLNYSCDSIIPNGIKKVTKAIGITALNPFNNSIILFSGNKTTNVTATLSNALGVSIRKWENVTLNSGKNTFYTELPISNGVYFLTLNNTQFNATLELVRMNGN